MTEPEIPNPDDARIANDIEVPHQLRKYHFPERSFGTKVGFTMRKIDLGELTCQYPPHIKPGAKWKRQAGANFYQPLAVEIC